MRIYITHVAGRVDPELFQRGVQRLEDSGVSVVHDERFLHPSHAYLAHANDDLRAADLVTAFRMPGVDAIIAARGGFGTMRTLACLRGEPMLQGDTRRPVVGFSDITALHLYLQNRGLPAIHGPVVTSLGASTDPDATASLVACLQRPELGPTLALSWSLPPDDTRHSPSSGPARLVGGNLALLAANTAMLEPLLADSLFFLEDVGEATYRLDRALQTLRPLVARARPRAVLLGDFTRSGDPDHVQACLLDALAAWGVPVAAGLPVGHSDRNVPLRLDRPWLLDTTDPTCPTLRQSTAPDDTVLSAPTLLRADVPIAVASSGTRWAGRAPAPDTPPGFIGAAPGVSNEARRSLDAQLSDLARRLVQQAASAVAIRVSVGDELVAAIDHGLTSDPVWAPTVGEPQRVDPSCVFDLASVTKALCTAILVHRLVDEGAGRLTDRLASAVSLAQPSILELLRHSSGLPAHLPFFESLRGGPPTAPTPGDIVAMADRWRRVAPVSAAGQTNVYSDVGYILLGRWLEAVCGQSLDALFQQCVAAPLALPTLAFRPWSSANGADPHRGRLIAATELCPWRGAPLSGIVHDENAQHLGGVAGHAGLFGTADDVAGVVRDLLRPTPTLLSARARDRMWDPQLSLPGSTWVCGWDTPSAVASTAGRGHTPSATFGHLGFTGTSVWVDRQRQLSMVLLTNRVHRGRNLPGFNDWRRSIHQTVLDVLGWSPTD
jgi:muramoyltetrapeptide carboxypeptidase LdcA involved in peptidoglycan recycling/CubicO group peptidase (beta-lactamase class C family)